MPPFEAPRTSFNKIENEINIANAQQNVREVQLPKHDIVETRAAAIIRDSGLPQVEGRQAATEWIPYETGHEYSGALRLAMADVGSVYLLQSRLMAAHPTDIEQAFEAVHTHAVIGTTVTFNYPTGVEISEIPGRHPLTGVARGEDWTPDADTPPPAAIKVDESFFQDVEDTLAYIEAQIVEREEEKQRAAEVDKILTL